MKSMGDHMPSPGPIFWHLPTLRGGNAEAWMKKLLDQAGIRINGRRPWDIQIHQEAFFDRILADGSLGVGESYMDGWWDCDQIDEMTCRLFRAKADRSLRSWPLLLEFLRAKFLNLQRKSLSFKNAGHHYDIGDDLYEKMLDRARTYSCAYWKGAKTLEEAQEHKLDLCCKKLGLKPGMKVLDVGCGWGSFAKHAAEKYRVRVVGITVSKNQYQYAKERCRDLDVEIRRQDYRDLKSESFDRAVSIGMFEHVGLKNYRRYMQCIHDCLRPDGLFLLHSIGNNESHTNMDPWVQRYIFPNAVIPSIAQIGAALEGLFIMEDWHNIGPDYDKTLMAWFERFDRNWGKLRAKYSERFYRMWKFYLLSCAGGFRAREMQVWQVCLSKGGSAVPWLR